MSQNEKISQENKGGGWKEEYIAYSNIFFSKIHYYALILYREKKTHNAKKHYELDNFQKSHRKSLVP